MSSAVDSESEKVLDSFHFCAHLAKLDDSYSYFPRFGLSSDDSYSYFPRFGLFMKREVPFPNLCFSSRVCKSGPELFLRRFTAPIASSPRGAQFVLNAFL